MEKAERQRITSGAPQGSLLGPVLFLVYVTNDQTEEVNFNMLIFANDATLLKRNDTGEDC